MFLVNIVSFSAISIFLSNIFAISVLDILNSKFNLCFPSLVFALPHPEFLVWVVFPTKFNPLEHSPETLAVTSPSITIKTVDPILHVVFPSLM